MSGLPPLSGISSASSASSVSSFSSSLPSLSAASSRKTASITSIFSMVILLKRSIARKRETIMIIKDLRSDSLKDFDYLNSFLERVNKLTKKFFNKIFEANEKINFSYSLLSNPSSENIETILRTLSLEKIEFLLKQIPQDRIFDLYNYSICLDSLLHIACDNNNKELMDLLLSYIPKEKVRGTLLLKDDEEALLNYAIYYSHDNAALSIFTCAKENNLIEDLLFEKIKGLNFIQYLCVIGNTSLIISILTLLNSKERHALLYIEKEDMDKQPLALAILNKKFDTFNQILAVAPEIISSIFSEETDLIQNIFKIASVEAFQCLNNHFIKNEYEIDEFWKRAFLQKNSFNFTPIEWLSRAEDSKNAILILEKIKKILKEEDYNKLLLESQLLLDSLAFAKFPLATYLILQNPTLACQIRSKNKQNLLHFLAKKNTYNPSDTEQEERIKIFKELCSLFSPDQLRALLNEIDEGGDTPSSFALLNNFKELLKLFEINGGNSSTIDCIDVSKMLAQCFSIKGVVSKNLFNYNLEGSHVQMILKEVSKSLEILSLSFSIPKDLLELFSIFTFPEEQQGAVMKGRKIWMRALTLNNENGGPHAITLVGTSNLVFLINTAGRTRILPDKSEIDIPANIQPLISVFPPFFKNDFSGKILSIKNDSYANTDQLLADFCYSYGLKTLDYIPIQAQITGNCAYSSVEAGLLPFLALLNMEEDSRKITIEAFEKTLDEVYSSYDKLKEAIKQQILEKNRKVADKDLLAAIDSTRFIRYIKELINNTSNSLKLLIETDSHLTYLKPLDIPLIRELDTEISLNVERLNFINYLYSFGDSEINFALTAYILEKRLYTLFPFEEFLASSFLLKNSFYLDSFLNYVNRFTPEAFSEIFKSNEEVNFSYSLLSNPISMNIQSIFKLLSQEKIEYLFKQISEEQFYSLLNRDFSSYTFLNLVCISNNKDLMDLVLSRIPKVEVKKFLFIGSYTHTSLYYYAISNKLNNAALSIFTYAKENNLLNELLIEKENDLNFMQYLSTDGNTSLIISILKLLNLEEQESFLFIEKEEDVMQPLALALYNKKNLTFIEILNLVPSAIVILDNLKKCLSEKEYVELVLSCDLQRHSLALGNFELASYLVSQNPLIASQFYLKDKSNLWHVLATLTGPSQIKKSVEFFNKHKTLYKSDELRRQLNELDGGDHTPLALALFFDLEELAKVFTEEGGSSRTYMIHADKELAHRHSLKGSLPVDPFDYNSKTSSNYRLEGWYPRYVAQIFSKSLEILSSDFKLSKDLLALFSIFALPEKEQLEAMKKRGNTIWMRSLSLNNEDGCPHNITIVGSPEIICICNPEEFLEVFEDGVIDIPANIRPFIPLPGYSFENILSIKDYSYSNEFALMMDFQKIYSLKLLNYIPIKKGLKVKNSAYSSIEMAVLAYQILSEIEEGSRKIAVESIKEAADSVSPGYKELMRAIKWLPSETQYASLPLMIAVHSTALIKFARKLEFLKYLIEKDPALLWLKSRGIFSEQEKAFYTDVSLNKERLAFIEYLFSLGDEVRFELENYINEKNLFTLLYLKSK